MANLTAKKRRQKALESAGGKISADLTIDVYRDAVSLPELRSLYRKLAKRSNQRLVRLEAAHSKTTGESYADYGAAQIAYDWLKTHKGTQGKLRFTEKANVYSKDIAERQELKHAITVMQGFLLSKSSTVKGQRQIEEKRIKAFKEGRYGSSYKLTGERAKPIEFSSNKEFYDFLSSQTFTRLVNSGFTSEQMVELYESARENNIDDEKANDKIMAAFEEALEDYRKGQKASLKELESRMNSLGEKKTPAGASNQKKVKKSRRKKK